MKKSVFLFLGLFASLQAQNDLSMLIEKAQENELVEIYKQKVVSSEKGYEAARSSYFPRIDLGAGAQYNANNDVFAKGPFDAGQIYSAQAQVNIVLLDGFKRENLLDEKTELKKSSNHSLVDIQKQVSLNVSSLYFGLKNIQADIKALKQTKEQLNEQLKRQEQFFQAKLISEDNVERIKAAIANTDYAMESLLYNSDEATAQLYTLTNVVVENIDNSSISAPDYEDVQELDSLKALASQSSSLGYKAEQANSVKYPSITFNDTMSYMNYQDLSFGNIPIEFPELQNKASLNLSLNVFDYGAASDQRQAILAEQSALKANLAYQRKSATADLKLAQRGIKRSESLIKSAKASQEASQKTFDIIDAKYKARVVDYVKYLDALTQLTDSQAQYNRALGALEISYARYYFYAGFDVKDFIK